MARLIGNEVVSNGPRYTQVYQVTHEGEQRLPFMNRSFISFSYGERINESGNTVPVYIEDFNLIATVSGDRMERDLYGTFADLTTTYDTIPGQFYWGTYFHNNSIAFNLSTDGMTQRELDDFKYWFRAGESKELVLSEHPNRATMARVVQPPQMHLLPFEKKIDVAIGNNTYQTSTTLYKGDIDLELVMDEPFWYAKKNVLGIQDTTQGYYKESWINANGVEVTVKDTPDALKIVYEDRIPLGSTTQVSVFLGGDVYANVVYELYSQIADDSTAAEYNAAQNNSQMINKMKAAYFKYNNKYYKGASIAEYKSNIGEWLGGFIGGAEISSNEEQNDGVSLSPGGHAHLYYAGTAPSPVKLQFTLHPIFASNYILISPYSKYAPYDNKNYNTITLEATRKHVFQFSLPTLYASYNQILQIFDNSDIMTTGQSWVTVRETIRDTIRDPYVRAWANKLIDFYNGKEDFIPVDFNVGNLKYGMELMFLRENTGFENTVNGMPATFIFDGKRGTAIGRFTIRDPGLLNLYGDSFSTSQIFSQTNDNFLTLEQNVGDMVKSNYLILDERNVLDDKLQIRAWEYGHPDYAYRITHDLSNTLENVHFEFKNMYL